MQVENMQQEEILDDVVLLEAVKSKKLEVELRERMKQLRAVTVFDTEYRKYKKKLANSRIKTENFCLFHDKFSKICTGEWVTDREGIFKQVPNHETGFVDVIEASRMKIVPDETYINMDTKCEKVRICFYKWNKWNNIICDKSTISISHKIVELSSYGLDVTTSNNKDLVDYLYDCLTLNDSDSIPYYPSISRMGWVDDKFMPYTYDIKFDGEKQNKSLYNALSSKGDKTSWIEYTSKLREKSKLLRLQMASSFASPLIEKLNLLPFILHMWGKSGSGKTVGMIVSMSIWGNPKMGELTKSLNNTINSVMDMCAFMKNLPVALDELQMVKDKMGYDRFVMMICEGVERGRMKFDENKHTRTWKNSFLFTGEEPIVNCNSGGGVFNRVIEVDVTGKEVVDPEKGAEIVEFYGENHGLISQEYIDSIIKDMPKIMKKYKDIYGSFSKKSTNKQIMAMSLILLGDYLARKYFFKDEDEITIEDVEEHMFLESDVDITERCYNFVRSIISINRKNFSSNSNGEIWGRIDHDRILFQKDKLEEILKNKGFEIKSMIKTWKEKGYIFPNSQGRNYINTMVNGVKSNYYQFEKDSEDAE